MMQAAHLIQACTRALICFNYKGQPFQLSKLHLTIVRLPTRSSKQTNLNDNTMYIAKAARAKIRSNCYRSNCYSYRNLQKLRQRGSQNASVELDVRREGVLRPSDKGEADMICREL